VLSIGDYIISGGEAAALVFIETVSRLIKGVIGNEECIKDDTFTDKLQDYPQYTKPRVFRGISVPDVLLSGDHSKIKEWRKQETIRKLMKWRPELISKIKKMED